MESGLKKLQNFSLEDKIKTNLRYVLSNYKSLFKEVLRSDQVQK